MIFGAFGFCYTVNTEPSMGLLSDNPAVVLCHSDPEALDLQNMTLFVHQQIIDAMGVEVDQLRALVLGLYSCRVGQSTSSPLSSPSG